MWFDISTAPKDGTVIEGRRMNEGREVWRGLCKWRIGFIEDDIAKFDPLQPFIGWMLPDRDLRARPTEWRPADHHSSTSKPA
jgi:hypothetical protein